MSSSRAWVNLSHRGRRVTHQRVVLILLCSFFSFIRPGYPGGENQANGSAQLDAFIKDLKRIQTEYNKHAKFLSQIEVNGKLYPENKTFHLLVSDKKCRFDMDPDGRRGNAIPAGERAKEIVRNVRISDGKNYYAVNEGSMSVHRLDDFEFKWHSDIAGSFYQFYMPEFDGIRPVNEWCAKITEFMESHRPEIIIAIEKQMLKARVIEDNEFCIVELIGPDATDGSGSIDVKRIKLDKHRGYLPVFMEYIESPEAGSAAWRKHIVVNSSYSEVAPNVFFLTDGTITVEKTSRSKREQNSSTIKIDDVKIGDFDVAKTAFDIHSLDIRPGIHVSDKRVSPPLQYIYKETPFNIEVLNKAVRDAGGMLEIDNVQSGKWTLLIWLNVALVFVVILALLSRYRQSKR